MRAEPLPHCVLSPSLYCIYFIGKIGGPNEPALFELYALSVQSEFSLTRHGSASGLTQSDDGAAARGGWNSDPVEHPGPAATRSTSPESSVSVYLTRCGAVFKLYPQPHTEHSV